MAINFPTSLDSFSTKVDNTDDVMAVDINDVQDAIEALEAKVGVDSSAVTGSLDYKVNNFFTSSRKLWLYENSAPTGWTYASGVTDRHLAVKGGTNAYNANGGTTAGTWTWPGYALVENDLPDLSHLHGIYRQLTGGGALTAMPSNALTRSYTAQTDSQSVGNPAGADSHSHGGTTFRTAAALGIIVSKN